MPSYTKLILEHNNLSLSNNRFFHEGFSYSPVNYVFCCEIVDSNAYKEIIAKLFPSSCNK